MICSPSLSLWSQQLQGVGLAQIHFANNKASLKKKKGYTPSLRPLQRAKMEAAMETGQLNSATPKQFVLCFDGTGNKFAGDESDSNVLKIYRVSFFFFYAFVRAESCSI